MIHNKIIYERNPHVFICISFSYIFNMKSYSKKRILQGTLIAEFQGSRFKFFPDFYISGWG
jgi:hypothetical protein